VAVLHKGRLQQCGTPQDLYERPDNIFVAAFIGSPAMNLYEGTLSLGGGQVKLGSQWLSLPPSVSTRRPGLAGYANRKLVIGVRPEQLADAALGAGARAPGSTLVADVEIVEALGNELQVHFLIDAVAARTEDTDLATGTSELGGFASVGVEGSRAGGVARISPRSAIKAGARVTFTVDTERLHFFDIDTGAAIWS
jgi:multiple sugar transport system ATP-binding protein